MNLINIANVGRKLYLFCRDNNYQQEIREINDYYPFFYEPDNEEGNFISYDGVKLSKIVCQTPADVAKQRSPESYSSDVRYIVNYLTQEVKELSKTKIKYFFLDIEVLTPDLPDVKDPKYPVSCVTIYNSANKEYVTFYLGDYEGSIKKQEIALITDLINYFEKEKPDLWLSWNVNFDYLYLYNRIKNFAKLISPINQVRVGSEDDTFYPAGISVLDYLTLFKKVNMRENSYKLDSVAEKYLGKGKKYKDVNFAELNDEIKPRNREDVELLVKLEEKFRILEYFDEIRCFSKAIWEDLTHNSKILDSIILTEAYNRKVVLPNKKKKEEDDGDDFELEGAYRKSIEGLYFDIYKADCVSMYPNQLVNFCLDSNNIVKEQGSNIIKVNGILFKQDPKALLPYLATKLMSIKDDLKKKLNAVALNSEENKILQMKYDAYKGLVNSLFGVTCFPSFRLYNEQVASSITFLARDLLHYMEDNLNILGCEVIYTDTDAVMYRADCDKVELLNQLVKKWGKLYNKDVQIKVESEGKFLRLLIVGKCHYYGYIETKKGIKKEVKGMEVKRASSSKFESKFQESLIEKILDKVDQCKIDYWIEDQKKEIKKAELEEIAFPCKVGNKQYKNLPIFIRALQNTQNLNPNFKVTKGENFFYIFINSLGKDSNGKDINVLAFKKDDKKFIDRNRIDWLQVINRNIDMKADAIFKAIEWKNVNTLF